MVKVSVTNLAGQTQTIEAEEGLSLMENIRNNDFDDLAAICGGCCSCWKKFAKAGGSLKIWTHTTV